EAVVHVRWRDEDHDATILGDFGAMALPRHTTAQGSVRTLNLRGDRSPANAEDPVHAPSKIQSERVKNKG
ncbi:hypothetical protein ABZ401_33335, partial [Streptomyces sp. NPDC005892]|uniref:hypothetical protein n=1 Tax=Streptomyces sp. NPDC005892 TaxID=3155593 RepID=UPI0033DEB5C0